MAEKRNSSWQQMHFWQLCLSVLLLLFTTFAHTEPECTPSDIKTLESEMLGLESIHRHFQDLSKGNLSDEFTLSSVFTIELLDSQDVASRIDDLHKQLNSKAPRPTCDSRAYKDLFQQRNQLNQQLTTLRLNYLALTLEERNYLESLISISQRLTNTQKQLQQALDQTENTQQTLKAKLETLEQDFKTQQDPILRAQLSNRMTEIDKQLHELNEQAKQTHKLHKAVSNKTRFANALLVDYHQVYIAKNYQTQAALPIFSRLASLETTKKLLSPETTKGPEGNKPSVDLAALFIIHSRIYSYKRKQTALNKQIPTVGDRFFATLNHELKTLGILPAANLHLKLYNRTQKHHYLSKTFYQSAANLVTQLVIAFVLWMLLKRLPGWIHTWQRKLVRHYLTKRFSRWLIGLLRIVQPNAAWLSAIILFYYLDNLSEEALRDWLLLYDLAAISAFYLLINTLATWTIGNTNSRAHLFVLRSKQLTIANYCHRYAFYITLISVLYIVILNLLNGGIICTLYQFAIIIAIWLFSHHLIHHFQPEFETHLSKRFSEQTIAKYKRLQKPILRVLVNPAIFTALQLIDFINGIHNRLLHIESYQTLTAKFLKIRLEQSQATTEAPTKETQDDVHYENWFFNKDFVENQSGIMVKSQLVEKLNTLAKSWLEGKQDENDLALIGEYGIGKSTLVRQWLKQWQDSKTLYIKTPPKTCTDTGIFNLITEALELNDTKEIAQFVIEQQSIEKTIIVIDEAQNLFLSDVGCFDGYKMLQSLMNAKLDNIYWIVVINQQSWIYLNDVFSRTYQFSNRINIQRWTQQEIRDLILNRHRASRRRLSYDELLLASTSHSETATRAAESRCFSLLWDQSSGIPAVALSIWVNTSRTPTPGQIEMGIPERPASTLLNELSDDQLFVYAALVVHETLNTQQAQSVTHLPEAIVRRALKLGLDQGFLLRKSHGRYVINPLWYLQLCQLLRRKNFLHE